MTVAESDQTDQMQQNMDSEDQETSLQMFSEENLTP